MIITIDTNKDSKQDIKMAIEFLSNFVKDETFTQTGTQAGIGTGIQSGTGTENNNDVFNLFEQPDVKEKKQEQKDENPSIVPY